MLPRGTRHIVWDTGNVIDHMMPTCDTPEEENYPGRATISHQRIVENLARLRQAAPSAMQMVIVKANAYGHGLVPVALTALACGAEYLGAAQVPEALSLRAGLDQAGVPRQDARIFSWIGHEATDWQAALEADLELSVSSVTRLAVICGAVRSLRDQGRQVTARLHVKIDTGMNRAGARLSDLPALAAAVRMVQDEGVVEVVGVWSHLHSADDLSARGRQATELQRLRFEQGIELLGQAGVHPRVRHLAATSGILWHPECHYDMVRPGIGVYGLSPNPEVASERDLGLTPVMTLSAPLTMVKRVEAGEGVSYGHTWVASEPTWVGLVPLGYADGILRVVSNRGEVSVPALVSSASNEATVPPLAETAVLSHDCLDEGMVGRAQIIGRVCMDQFMVNLGPASPDSEDPPAHPGDRVVLFSSGVDGQPTASEWAQWAETINYEVLCRVGERVPREHLPATRVLRPGAAGRSL